MGHYAIEMGFIKEPTHAENIAQKYTDRIWHDIGTTAHESPKQIIHRYMIRAMEEYLRGDGKISATKS